MKRILAAALAISLFAGAAAAHDLWLEPSAFRPAPGDTVAIRIWNGVDFDAETEAVPRTAARIVRFSATGPSGEVPVSGPEMSDPAGAFAASEAGLWIVAYRTNNKLLELPGEKFEEYLAQEGLERISALRAERGETAKPTREHFSRCAKALVAAGGSRAGGDRALGLTLELVAGKNPYALAKGEPLPVRLLYEGKPLEGALVVAVAKQDPARRISARTDAKGNVSFRLPASGMWLIKAVHAVPAPAGSGVDWESLWASLTFARD
ncbi:MAG TPA: DUF4198 domain-containing protein [Thermoanaerobaculia bacterium]